MTLAASPTRARATCTLLLLAALTLCGCGGGGDSGNGGGNPPPTYTVSATVSGLTSTGLVLQLNAKSNLAVTTNGAARFSMPLASGSSYVVAVSTQPAGQTCTVANGTGTVGSGNVTSPAVSCDSNSTPQYTVTVNVSGFASGPTLVLQLNGLSQLAITGNGSATFTPLLGTGENYVVTVKSQPTPPPQQNCTIANGSGTIGTASITNVNVTCTTTYSVGVSVLGLAGTGFVVQLNGADDLPITINDNGGGAGSGTFSTQLASGATYTVTIKTQPTTPTQTCTISNGSGTIGTANVTVSASCTLIYSATTKGDWTLMSLPPALSSQMPNCTGTPANPGVRAGSLTWTDTEGNLWLYGGTTIVPPYGDEAGPTNGLWKYIPSAGTWICVSAGGPNLGSFGTKGVASSTNWPPVQAGSNVWTDTTGNLWLFGGGYNTLWKYNIAGGEWTWVAGTSTPDAGGVYGAQGTPTVSTTPGSRIGPVSWRDSSGNLWLFGGENQAGGVDLLNDLWEYSPTSGLWVWVAGSVAGTSGAGPVGIYGTKGVASNTNVPGGRWGAVAWTDSAGNLWLFGGYGVDSKGTSSALNDLWKYTPSATFGALGTWTWVGGSDTANAVAVYGTQGIAAAGNIPGARYTATAWTDLSGNFWMFGGYGCATSCSLASPSALNDLWKYSSSSGTWTWMKGATTVEGAEVDGTIGVPASNNTPGSWFSSIGWTDASGNLWLYGGQQVGNLFYSGQQWVYTPE